RLSPQACCAPTRPRPAAKPRGASSRGRTPPARGRGRPPGGGFLPCRYGREMTALEGELAAAGGAAAPPTAIARLREVLAGALKSGRAELAKPRSGKEHPVEVAIAGQQGSLVAAVPAAA